jgi:hypothetical protein
MEPLAELGRRLQALRDAQAYAPANIQPQEPQGYQGALPSLSPNDFGYGRPGVNFNVPLGGVDLQGSYRKRFPDAPPEWRAMLGLNKSF